MHRFRSLKHLVAVACAAAGLGVAPAASALDFTVEAQSNSAIGGAALDTGLSFTAGDSLTVSVDPGDLWSAGPLPRWSSADGLVANLFATGTDESGATAGTLIGQAFSNLSRFGLSAPYGSLVGQIDTTFFLIGTNFAHVAPATGTLKLMYWDENASDNADSVLVSVVTPVPEPSAAVLALLGLATVVPLVRRARRA
jgi:hypothetical protein